MKKPKPESAAQPQAARAVLDVKTMLGPLRITAEGKAITEIRWVSAVSKARSGNAVLRRAATQIQEYLSGRRRRFSLPLDPRGTPFQKRIWAACRQIPYGHTQSYGTLAHRAGASGASRAAGSAMAKNPLPIVIPCHRVVKSDGSSGKYSGRGGVRTKLRLLKMEET